MMAANVSAKRAHHEAQRTRIRCPTLLAAVGKGLLHAFGEALAERVG
jgi:hypothetical protein